MKIFVSLQTKNNYKYARDIQNIWNALLFLEPIHVHVKNADWKAKFDILENEIVLVKNEGMKIKNIKAAEMVLEENRELAIAKCI